MKAGYKELAVSNNLVSVFEIDGTVFKRAKKRTCNSLVSIDQQQAYKDSGIEGLIEAMKGSTVYSLYDEQQIRRMANSILYNTLQVQKAVKQYIDKEININQEGASK